MWNRPAGANRPPRRGSGAAVLFVCLGLVAVGITGYVLGRAHQTHLTAEEPKAPPPPPPPPPEGRVTYAQQAEDLIIADIFGYLGIKEIRYLDIGANDPIQDSNTYLFYKQGHRGVLVEPNPAYGPKYREKRPGDNVLEVGVGVTDQQEADYYMVDAHPGLNTFSKEVADKHAALGRKITVTKRKLVNINKVIADNFTTPPNFISIDIEGLDLDILKTLDFDKYRPAVICVETLVVNTRKIDPAIEEFMRSRKYTARGATFVNTIFVANELCQE
jgi:FkbM family methyltransferase